MAHHKNNKNNNNNNKQAIVAATRPQPQFATAVKLKKSELGAIKVIKYLFISSLIILIIGAVVLFGLSIDEIIGTSNGIDTNERYAVTELVDKYSQRLRHQKMWAIFSLVINMLTILLSSLGVIAVIKNHFFLIIVFAALNTLVLVISLWSSTAKAATILLQTLVSLIAFTYVLAIHLRFKLEIRRRKRARKEALFAGSLRSSTNGSFKSNSSGGAAGLKKNGVKINGAMVIDNQAISVAADDMPSHNNRNGHHHHHHHQHNNQEIHQNNNVVVFYDDNVRPNIV